MNMADILVMSVLLGITALIFSSMRRRKKQNKGCCGSCSGCHSSCHANGKEAR
ncbi:FeoB-associated Cys-rich membrane protein [Candidatus Soleaferrea massiliensis]|uniref:FeoB-associated Cys-rich membrane protein n=1 Tax=Candidatus Soleaferrea massiliensis TaxID=1470354 RepID=UPI0018CE957F|nr:FeoB-associated Cys-rich membrane protein [Candidatus Soleaferrea massiliensis]